MTAAKKPKVRYYQDHDGIVHSTSDSRIAPYLDCEYARVAYGIDDLSSAQAPVTCLRCLGAAGRA